MRRILALLILLAIPAVAQFGGPMGGMRPGSMQGGGLLAGRGGDPLWVAAGPTKPTLDFDFAKRKDLTDAVSGKTSLVNFSRSAAQSPGTYVGADGLIHDAAVNFELYSEQFDNAVWVKSGVTIEANQASSPDEKQTADRLTPTATNAIHSLQEASPYPASGNFSNYSVYVKADGYTKIALRESKSYGSYVSFDLAAETILDAATVSSGKIEGYGIENVGNGWLRIYANFGDITSHRWGLFALPETYTSGQPASSWLANGTDGYLIWGAQLEETDAATMAPTAYIKTTSQALAAPRFDHTPTTGNLTTNLITYSEMLDVSPWSTLRSTITANDQTDPFGGTNAEKLEQQSGQTTSGLVQRVETTTGAHTFSVYAKSNGKSKIFLQTGSFTNRTWFDLSAGTVGTTAANHTATSISDEGGGWYRVSVTYSISITADNFGIGLADTNGSITVADSGGLYLFGAQLEASPTPGPYVRTLSETRSISDANAESLGLLVEEARTNYFTNSDSLATQNVTTTATAYTLSFYGAGTIDLTGTHTATVVGAGDYPTRTTLTFTPTAGTLTATVTGTVQYAQLEQGAFPTSYIPTVTSQTRYADVAAVQDEDFSTTNLSDYSESFNVGWGTGGMNTPITANAIVAPDGQTTADLAIESTFTGTHVLYDSLVTTAAPHTWSVYAKKKERTWIKLVLSTGAANGAFFNLDSGTVGTVDSGYSATIEDAGNGWYRCKITKTTTAATHYTSVYLASDGSTTSYAGDGTSGVYLWGASLTATEYPVAYTTTRNLLTDSQDFERSSWIKTAATIGNDSAQAPDGTATADKLIATSASGGHFLRQIVSFSSDSTYSFYAKAGEYSSMMLFTAPTYKRYGFDLLSGTAFDASGVGGTGTPADAHSIENVGNGWYRCSIKVSSGTDVQIYIVNNSGTILFSGDNTSGLYVWGAQLEPGTATEYVRTVDTVGKSYNWYEPTEGTVFVEGERPNLARYVMGFSVGSTSSFMGLRSQGFHSTAGTISLAVPESYKGAFGVKYNDAGLAVNSTLATGLTSFVVPLVNQMMIGDLEPVANRRANGHIKRLTYWPRRQADSTLQVITQ